MRAATRGRIERWLSTQCGLVTSAQLAEAGVDPELPRREGWRALAPGTWSASDQPPTDEQLIEGIGLYAGPDAVPTGALACRWLLLDDVPERVEADLLVAHGRRLRGGPLLVVHQSSRLPKPVRRRRRTVAPPARAVADAARCSGDLRAVRALVLGTLHRGFVDVDRLRAEHAVGARRGRAVLGRALADWDRGARSAPEAEAADALLALPAAARMPPFLLNPELVVAGRYLGCPDGYLPGLGFGWEVDSVRYHGSSNDLDATLSRHEAFADAGIVLAHVVPSRLRRDPASWAAKLAAKAVARGAAGGRDPAGLLVLEKGPLLGR